MNPPCAKCNKTVYPVEKLNCLDKVRVAGKTYVLVVRELLSVCVLVCGSL